MATGKDKDEIRRLQVKQIMHLRVSRNLSLTDVAKEMNMSTKTVSRRLQYADKAGILVELEEQMFRDLIPAGMRALKTAMEDGDAETALELFKSLGVLKDPRAQKTQAQVQEEDNLLIAINETREQKKLEAETHDGEIIDGRRQLAGLIESGDFPADEQAAKAGDSTDGNSVESSDSTPAKKTP